MATALEIREITEFSLVPKSLGKPANEHATVVLTKTEEGGTQVPNETLPTDIQKALQEEIALLKAQAAAATAKAEAEAVISKANAEEIAKMKEAEAIAKCENRLVSQGISKALAADFRTMEKAAPESAARIEAALAKAEKRAAAVEKLTKSVGEYVAPEEGSIAARLNKAVADLQTANPGMTHAQAITKAITINPSLAGE